MHCLACHALVVHVDYASSSTMRAVRRTRFVLTTSTPPRRIHHVPLGIGRGDRVLFVVVDMQAAGEQGNADAVAAADTHLSEYESRDNAASEVREADGEDAELEAMKQRVAEMEAEAAKLREMNDAAEQEMGGAGTGSAFPTEEEKMEVDSRSIYVGNVRTRTSHRSTTARRRKRSSSISRAAVRLTVSPFCVISSRVTPRVLRTSSLPTRRSWRMPRCSTSRSSAAGCSR